MTRKDRLPAYRRAWALQDHRDFAGSAAKLEQHAREHPEDAPEAYSFAANCYVNLWLWSEGTRPDHRDRVVEYCQKALAVDPRSTGALYSLSVVWKKDRPAESEAFAKRAREIQVEDGLVPPPTVRDPVAWDRYWRRQIEDERPDFGPGSHADIRLPIIKHMRSRGFTRILLAGNGLSQEPKLFAAAGLLATALDLSPVATAFARDYASTVHVRLADEERRPGGRADFVAGDLFDPAVLPGPFDVILSRRTWQLMERDEAAVSVFVDRLVKGGLLINHAHNSRSYEEDFERLRRRGLEIAVAPARDEVPAVTGERGTYWELLSSG